MDKGKIIMLQTGPTIKYRLDLFDYCCPSVIKDKVIFFTDKFTYDNLGHRRNNYNFVLIEEYRKNENVSLEYEKLIQIWDEGDYYDEIKNFYGYDKGRLFPYDIVRFVFKYLAENNIRNFIIMDTDTIIKNSPFKIDEIFERTKEGVLYMPQSSHDLRINEFNSFYKKNFSEKYPNLNFDLGKMRPADGYIKGFHFKNNDDLLLFFNLWNDGVNNLLQNFFTNNLITHNVNIFCDTFWIIYYIMELFEKNIDGYEYNHSHSYMWDGFMHMTRAEEKLYYSGEISYYKHYNFIYDGVRTVADFVNKNQEQLKKYYGERTNQDFILEITNSHVFIKHSY